MMMMLLAGAGLLLELVLFGLGLYASEKYGE